MCVCVQDDQKAADELAKKRAAFLLKQQKKAEEARLRKQQLEAESELKRDEARYVHLLSSCCLYVKEIKPADIQILFGFESLLNGNFLVCKCHLFLHCHSVTVARLG